jgi:nucleoside-diphosphate-sugar epimerase
MAEVIRELAASNVDIVHRDLPVDDPKVRQPDIARARTELSWEPAMGIREGLALTMEDFRKRLE